MSKEQIYLIKSGKYHKIGKSQEPERRLKDLQMSNPIELKLIETTTLDDIISDPRYVNRYKRTSIDKLEAVMHSRLHSYRVRGEWFELPEKVLNQVLKFMNGKIKLSSLGQPKWDNVSQVG